MSPFSTAMAGQRSGGDNAAAVVTAVEGEVRPLT